MRKDFIFQLKMDIRTNPIAPLEEQVTDPPHLSLNYITPRHVLHNTPWIMNHGCVGTGGVAGHRGGEAEEEGRRGG